MNPRIALALLAALTISAASLFARAGDSLSGNYTAGAFESPPTVPIRVEGDYHPIR